MRYCVLIILAMLATMTLYAYAKLDMYDAAKKVIAGYRKTAKFREEDIAYLYGMFPSLQ